MNEEIEEGYEPFDLIAAAYNALAAIEGIDPITATAKARISKIKRKAIILIEASIDELYSIEFTSKKNHDEDSAETDQRTNNAPDMD
jgi:hypothetical protein